VGNIFTTNDYSEVSKKTKLTGAMLAVTMLANCTEMEPLSEYTPVVDHNFSDSKDFERDVQECRSIALRVQDDYRKRQEKQMAANMMAGLIVGAATGAIIGNNTGYQGDYIAAGAATGVASGAAATDYTYDLVKYGPRRIVDRCMANRGHQILNDIGRG